MTMSSNSPRGSGGALSMSDMRTLTNSTVQLGEHAQEVEGKLLVLICAVEAVLQTHPDHAAFAEAFRRSWQLAGSHHSNTELGAQTQSGIDAVLHQLEEACRVPLNVRPVRE